MDNPIEQLVSIYINEELWDNDKLSEPEAYEYFKKKVDLKNIVFHAIDGEIVAYMEVWLITYEQLKRLIGGKNFDPSNENVTDGDYCYVNDVYIREGFRGNGVLKKLRKEAYDLHPNYTPKLITLNEVKNKGRLRTFMGDKVFKRRG